MTISASRVVGFLALFRRSVPDFFLACIVALSVAALVLFQPVFQDTFVTQVDHRTHLRWLMQFHTSLAEGVFIPRWAFGSHGGLGDPTFLYYSPFFYYLASAVIFLVSDVSLAVRLTLLAMNAALGLVAFCALHRFMSRTRALISMALIQALPIVLILQVYYGALPWVVASPFVLAFAFESTSEHPRVRMLAVWLALCVLTHILSAFMLLLSVGAGQLWRVVFSKITLTNYVRWLGGIVMGLSLAGFYLMPALTLQEHINPGGWTSDPTLDWRRAFAFPFVTYFQYGGSVLTCVQKRQQ